MKCPNCGEFIPKDKKGKLNFCGFCGTNLRTGEKTTVPNPEPKSSSSIQNNQTAFAAQPYENKANNNVSKPTVNSSFSSPFEQMVLQNSLDSQPPFAQGADNIQPSSGFTPNAEKSAQSVSVQPPFDPYAMQEDAKNKDKDKTVSPVQNSEKPAQSVSVQPPFDPYAMQEDVKNKDKDKNVAPFTPNSEKPAQSVSVQPPFDPYAVQGDANNKDKDRTVSPFAPNTEKPAPSISVQPPFDPYAMQGDAKNNDKDKTVSPFALNTEKPAPSISVQPPFDPYAMQQQNDNKQAKDDKVSPFAPSISLADKNDDDKSSFITPPPFNSQSFSKVPAFNISDGSTFNSNDEEILSKQLDELDSKRNVFSSTVVSSSDKDNSINENKNIADAEKTNAKEENIKPAKNENTDVNTPVDPSKNIITHSSSGKQNEGDFTYVEYTNNSKKEFEAEQSEKTPTPVLNPMPEPMPEPEPPKPKMERIISYIGQDRLAAENMLSFKGLKANFTYVEDEKDFDFVIAQSIPADTEVEVGSTITLTLSAGTWNEWTENPVMPVPASKYIIENKTEYRKRSRTRTIDKRETTDINEYEDYELVNTEHRYSDWETDQYYTSEVLPLSDTCEISRTTKGFKYARWYNSSNPNAMSYSSPDVAKFFNANLTKAEWVYEETISPQNVKPDVKNWKLPNDSMTTTPAGDQTLSNIFFSAHVIDGKSYAMKFGTAETDWYIYRKRTLEETRYYFEKEIISDWSPWTDWSETEHTASEDCEVEKRTLTRYKRKIPKNINMQ